MLALVIVVTVTAVHNSNFVSKTSLQQLLSGAAIIAILAIGETIVIITRNVDLSIGSILGISAYAVGVTFQNHPHVWIPWVFLIGMAIGLACGIVNGAIVTIARVPSLVVTLGTLYVIRGLDARWAGGHQVGASALPNSFTNIGYGTVLGVPYLGHRRHRRRRGRDVRDAHVPHAARLLRDRLEPGRGAARRNPRRAACVPGLRAQRRHRRRGRGVLALAATAPSTRSPARATSSR